MKRAVFPLFPAARLGRFCRSGLPSLILLASAAAFAQMADKNPAIRQYDPDEIRIPPGYTVEAFATKLDFPVDVAFGDQGEVYVAEAGFHAFGVEAKKAPPAQIVKLRPDGNKEVVYDKVVPMDEIRKHDSSAAMPEGIIPPLAGLTCHDGKLYVSHRSRYSVLDPNTGDFKTILNGLPCWGEFLNVKPVFDRQGKMVFHIATQGNSGGALYVVDFGVITFKMAGNPAHSHTGAIWKVRHLQPR